MGRLMQEKSTIALALTERFAVGGTAFSFDDTDAGRTTENDERASAPGRWVGDLDGSRQSACDHEFDGGLRPGRQQFRIDVPKGRLDERIDGIGLSVPRRALDELKTLVIKRDKFVGMGEKVGLDGR